MLLQKVKRKIHISNRNQLLCIPSPVLINQRGNRSLQRFLQGNYCLFFKDSTVFIFLHTSPLQLPPLRKQISYSYKRKIRRTVRKLVLCIMWTIRRLNFIPFYDLRLQNFMGHAVYTNRNCFSVINAAVASRRGTAA